jgi:uncharacterized lipoprotein YajG
MDKLMSSKALSAGLIIAAVALLAGCSHTQAGSTTPPQMQQSIQQNLQARAAWIKTHPAAFGGQAATSQN